MNEQFKRPALSIRADRRSEKWDNETSSAIRGDLKRFLIHRQLLAIESKKIQGLRLEAEASVKAKQDDLANLRDRAFAFLGDLSKKRMEQAAEVERLRQRGTLKTLPKTLERHIRQKAKQLFVRPKSTSAGTVKRPKAVPADEPRWLLPKVEQLDAWARWFAECDAFSREPVSLRKDRIQVALVVSGGIGDLLKSTHLVAAISDQFSCDVTIVTAQRAVGQVVAHNPYVNNILVSAQADVLVLADELRHIPVFDLVVVWKYLVEYIIPQGSRLSRSIIRSLESESSALRKVMERYCFLHGWPLFNSAFSRDAARLGLSAMNVSCATSGLHRRSLDKIPFFPGKQSLRVIAPFLTKSYVTIHHGFDLNCLPSKTRNTDYYSTKNISIQQWIDIVSLLREEGIEVVQLGVIEEQKIDGVNYYLNGLTSLEETGLLLKHGLCHIDTEGGLVHLANAVHARCVVLFGPTPVSFFAYSQNINLEPSGCKACWFATETWMIECPRHTSGPECMKEHSPSRVVDAAKRIIADTEIHTAQLIAAEERRPAPTFFAETLAKTQTLLDRDTATRILVILDDPSHVGSDMPDGVLDRCDIMVCGERLADAGPHDRIKCRFEYGSLLNLSRASSSVDGILWVSRELEADIAPFALGEFFRVLRPGGSLVIAAFGETSGLDLSQSLSAAQISLSEGAMPSAPVYSCSLRKGLARPGGHPSHPRSAGATKLGGPTRDLTLEVDPKLAPIEAENARQITLVRDRVAEREKAVNEANSIINKTIEHGFGEDGWIWISGNFANIYAGKFFIRGWHDVSDSVIWSGGNKCLLLLPLPAEPSSRGHDIEVALHVALPDTSASNPTAIGVRIDEGPTKIFHLIGQDAILTVLASTESSKYRGVSLVELEMSATERGRPNGSAMMGITRFRYRVLTHHGAQRSE
jgi:ADP-heptose:LPS heptosyltransferase